MICVVFLLGHVLVTEGNLYGEGGASLIKPEWHGGVDELSKEPPIFIIRGLLTAAETEQIIDEYAVDLLPEFELHSNDSNSLPCRLCRKIFPIERCAHMDVDVNDGCEFYTDNGHYISNLMVDVRGRISKLSGLPEDHIEAAWLMNFGRQRTAQKLHLDNNHHFMHPRRLISVLIRLDEDPVGIAFPLARLRKGAHPLAENMEFVDQLNSKANELPYKGSGTGRHFSEGPLSEALQELCRSSPIRAGKGDAVMYYHLTESGAVDVRSVHASCATESSSTPKLFMATWIRAESLLAIHHRLQTPVLPSDLRAWIDSRRSKTGLDASVVLSAESQDTVLDAASCPTPTSQWLVQLEKDKAPSIRCQVPHENNYTLRNPGESFDVYFTLANTGEHPWPAGTSLTSREGSSFGQAVGIRFPQVDVGQAVDLSMQLGAPPAGEKWYGIWSLIDADRRPFGTLLWVDAVGAVSASH